ncbi:MAG: DUF4351 domain-containing protein, partial [Methylococcales bacterium]|nr:DUF4351 domain-containing protein [Methylococcales bacterium]
RQAYESSLKYYRDLKNVIDTAREEGREEGQRALLHRQITLKYGELPENIALKLAQADITQLNHWSERILSADTLAQLFADS